MTTITTGTTGPKAWKMILAGAAVGLATIAIVNLPQTTSDTAGQQATDASQTVTAESPETRSFFDENPATGRTPALSESVAGFEYGNESTAGQAASPGVSTQYLGNSGELFPYENGPAPVQAPTGFGGPMPQATLNQAEINRLAPVITQEFLGGPSSATQDATGVDPRAAVGVPDAATNARWEALAEAYRTGPTSSYYTGDPDPVVGIPSNANAEAGTNARWGAIHEAYHNGTLSGYTTRSAGPDPADKKFLEG